MEPALCGGEAGTPRAHLLLRCEGSYLSRFHTTHTSRTCFIVKAPACRTPSANASQKPPDSRKRHASPGGARQARLTWTCAQYERPKQPTCRAGVAKSMRLACTYAPWAFLRSLIRDQRHQGNMPVLPPFPVPVDAPGPNPTPPFLNRDRPRPKPYPPLSAPRPSQAEAHLPIAPAMAADPGQRVNAVVAFAGVL